jgi:hypothetical protein
MNSVERKLTLQQERLAYRRAVRLVLSAFFDKTPEEAATLVDRWWQRMGKGPVYRTGLFMHDEPLNTAADLAHSAKTPARHELSGAYEAILRECMPKKRVGKQVEALPKSFHAA